MTVHRIMEASEFENESVRQVVVDGRDLAVIRRDGEFFCIDAICPHSGGPLAQGELEGEMLYCPWHFWPINIKTGEVPYAFGITQETYPCTIVDGSLYIEIPDTVA